MNPLTPDPRYPPAPHCHRLRLLQTYGDTAAAQRLLDALNMSRKASPYEMPPAYETGLPDVCAYSEADLQKRIREEQLTECLPDPLRKRA